MASRRRRTPLPPLEEERAAEGSPEDPRRGDSKPVGALGIPGGGASFYSKRRGAFDLSFDRGAETAARLVPEALLGRAVLEARDPPVRAVWVTAGNPVAMLPDSETVRRALRTRELPVVVDSFLTDTAAAAHVVLPTTTMRRMTTCSARTATTG